MISTSNMLRKKISMTISNNIKMKVKSPLLSYWGFFNIFF